MTKNITQIVIENIWLDETDGKATIAEAKDTFSGFIDPNFNEL